MYIKASEVAPLLPDNDFRYFTMLEAILNSIDSGGNIDIVRKPQGYGTRITPSQVSHIDAIIREILTLHNLLGLQIDLSKSIKTSGKIFYEINTVNN